MYDPLAESVELIESRQPSSSRQMWSDSEFVPMAVDVLDDVAVTAFARRSDALVWHDVHVLARRGAEWKLLGGGAASADGDLLAESPPGDDSDHGGGILGVHSSGGTHDDRGEPDRWPWSGRRIGWAEVRVTRQVVSLQVSSARGADRRLSPPWHGRVTVVWTGRGVPRALAHDRSGRTLGEIRLPR